MARQQSLLGVKPCLTHHVLQHSAPLTGGAPTKTRIVSISAFKSWSFSSSTLPACCARASGYRPCSILIRHFFRRLSQSLRHMISEIKTDTYIGILS